MKKKKRFTVVLIAVLAFAALCITACASKKNNAAAVPESFSVSRSTEAYIDEFNIADYSVSVRYSDGTEKTYSLADYIAQADLDLLATLGSHEITVNLGGYSATITFTIKNHAFDGVTFPSGTVEYDGKSHSLAVAGLPAGANVTYANNGKTEPGTYNVTATLTRENYATKTLNATLVIEKRELAVDITGETLIKYDGEEHKDYTVAATNLVDNNDKVDLTLSFSGNMKDAGTYTVTASLAEHPHYKLTGNNTLTVTITREIHTVTFRQSGQPDKTVEVADLGAVAEEDIPRPVQEAGYTVTWNADALAGLSSVTDDIVVEATKTPIQYNITYEVGEGTNNLGNPETYTVEDQLFTLLEPTPKRGSFGGWYTSDNAGGVRKTTIGGGETGDITLYAHWLEYYITSADGFTIDGTKLSIDVHNTVANLDLQDKIHVSAHCTWKLYKDFEGNSELTLKAISLNYGHNEAYVIVYSDESEYFTRYTLDIYRLSMREYKFTADGTDCGSGTIEEKSEVSKPNNDPTSKRTGYKFAGWAVSGSSDIVEFPYTVNEDVEFVAQWAPKKYTVHLNADGGAGLDEADKTMTYDSAYEFPVLTRTGYTFLGWFAGDDKLTEPNGKSTEPWTFDEDNKDITAKWQANKYHLTVESGDPTRGSVTGEGDFDYDSQVTITATTNPGYTFIGWYKDGERKSLELEYTFTKGLDETYTAKWIKVTLEATTGGEVTTVLDGTYIAGETVTYNATTKIGYTFIGWYDDSGSKLSLDLAYETTMTDKDTTYTAKWQANNYTVHLNADGGAGLDGTEKTVTYDSAYEFPVLTRTGYTFLGWYAGETQLTEADGQSKEPWTFDEDNKDITAKWQANNYHLTVESGDPTRGSVTGEGDFDYDSQVTITATTNPGYTFIGWYKDGERKSLDLEYTFAKGLDETYTAKWIKVTLETTEGGEVTTVLDGTYKAGEQVPLNTEITRLGYTFAGWYSGGEMVYADTNCTMTMPEVDTTYTATWKLSDEMSNFVFTSDRTTCTITGIKDNTVQEIVVPDYVTSIAEGAFGGCGNLISITLPFVGDKAHTATEDIICSQYPVGYIFGTSSYSGGTVTIQYFRHVIGPMDWSLWYAGYYIPTSLKTVTITGSSYIPAYAFDNCNNLTEITIPSSVTSIGDYAFSGCTNLQTVTFANPDNWQVSKNSDMSSPTTLLGSDLANPTTAAKYLRSTYDNYYWQRTEA